MVVRLNESHHVTWTESVLRILGKEFGRVEGLKVVVLGFTFKKDTNDVRFSVAAGVVGALEKEGVDVVVFDYRVDAERVWGEVPLDDTTLSKNGVLSTRNEIHQTAMERRRQLVQKSEICTDVYGACRNTNAIVLMNDDDRFMELDWKKIAQDMEPGKKLVFDGKGIMDVEYLTSLGFDVGTVGSMGYVSACDENVL